MIKKLVIGVSILLVISIVTLFSCDYYVSSSTKTYLYDNPNLIPKNRVGLLLGTSKYLSNGKINGYWKYRIDATVELYKKSKIKYVIISGDNSKSTYDEPTDMKNELVKRGIPESVIFLDYAGFRTFDSVIRAKKVFSQTEFTIISQQFHNERAIVIARHYGIKAIGYNAKDVTAYNGFKTKVREKFARVKLFLDFIIGNEPKFLGKKIEIPSKKS